MLNIRKFMYVCFCFSFRLVLISICGSGCHSFLSFCVCARACTCRPVCVYIFIGKYNDVCRVISGTCSVDGKSGHEDSSGSSSGDVYKIYLHAIKFLSPETPAAGHHGNMGLPLDGMPQGQTDR